MLTGSLVALVTPMLDDGRVDYDALKKMIDWQIAEGTDAIVSVGTTGESPTLTMDEHFQVIETTVKHTAKRVPVIAGTGANNTAEAVELAFKYDKMVLACATYDGGLFPVMQDFLYHLGHKNFQNKKVAFMENGSWAPVANKKMREAFEKMKNMTLCDNMVTIKSTMKEADVAQMEALADELLA